MRTNSLGTMPRMYFHCILGLYLTPNVTPSFPSGYLSATGTKSRAASMYMRTE